MQRRELNKCAVCRGMLAEKLLAKTDFDTDNDFRTLEHLKMRFGENNLHDCEVSTPCQPVDQAENHETPQLKLHD